MPDFETGPRDLPWSKNAYLLLNAINVPQLRRKLFEWELRSTFTLLFLQTPFSELLDHSPALISLDGPCDPMLARFLAHTREEWGLLLFSQADHKTLTGHLRSLVLVDQPVGKACYLNLSDPPVANALFGLHPGHTDSRLFGPIEELYAADIVAERWIRHERQGELPLHAPGERYRLSAEHIEALDEVSFRLTVISLDQHLRRFSPDYLPAADSLKSRYEHVYALASAAYEQGFNSEVDIFHYANVMAFLETQPADAHLDIRELLLNTSALTPSQRVKQANWMVVERTRQPSGASE